MNKNIKKQFGIFLACIGVYFSQSAEAGVVLWNKLGSAYEVTHSEIGPNGTIIGTSYAFEDAKFGKGYIRKSTGQNWVSFPSSVVDRIRNRGAMAVWITPKVPKPIPYQYGIFGLINTTYGPHSDQNIALCWGDGVTSQGIRGTIGFDNTTVATPPEPTQFVATPGVPFHAAIAWDINGIAGSSDKVRVYRNNQLVGSTSASWNPNGSNLYDIILGWSPDAGGYDKYITDNIVVWDYAKIDFSDRFTENPSAPPPAPTFHAIALSPTIMRLSWNDNASGEKGFRIQRKLGNCASTDAWATLLDVHANGIAAWDIPVTPNTTYSYQIASYYGGQTFSPYSACVSATSPVAGAPMVPNKLISYDTIAASQSNSQVNLVWNDASNNETRFDIYRKVNTGNWAFLNKVAANNQSYVDSTATGNMNTTSYSYAISACNAADGCSNLFQNPMVVPFIPTNLAATAATEVQLTWTDNSSNETGFQLLRKNGNCASTAIWSYRAGISANKQSFNDSNLVSGQIYSYKIRSYTKTAAQPYGFGYSGYSNCVTATAP